MFACVRGSRQYLLVACLCIPLFFVNVRNWSDWGDDFAQYLHQAGNLIDGKSQSETGYIFNENYPGYAPKVYPAGFPLLLTPVVGIFGNDIYRLDQYITLFLFLFALLLFAFLKKFYSSIISILIVLIFVYNPWTLSFKAEILSDIPFTVFLLALIVVHSSLRSHGWKFLILFSLLCAFTMLIRSVGIFIVLALLGHTLIDYLNFRRKKMKFTANNLFNLKAAILSMLIFVGLNAIFSSSQERVFNYDSIIDTSRLKSNIQENLTYYTGVLRAFFEPWGDKWHFVSIVSASMIFTFIILGWIKKIAKDYQFIDTLFIVYIITLLVYPYSNAGFRFLLPMIPLFSVYLLKGILSVDLQIQFRRNLTAIVLTAVVLFSYKKAVSEILRTQNIISEGPQLKENVEAFDFIIKNTSPEARFSFKRPRALALYTNRSSMTHRKDAPLEEIDSNIKSNDIQYIMINQGDYSQNVVDYIKANEQNFKIVWQNSLNTIYEIKTK